MPESTFNIEKWRVFVLLPLPVWTAIGIWGFAGRHWPLSTGQIAYVCLTVLLILFLACHSIWLFVVGRKFITLSDKGLKYYNSYRFKSSFVEWSQLTKVHPPQKIFGAITFSYTGKDGVAKTDKIFAGLLGKENAASLFYLMSEHASSD